MRQTAKDMRIILKCFLTLAVNCIHKASSSLDEKASRARPAPGFRRAAAAAGQGATPH
jgi:hypothetical protein